MAVENPTVADVAARLPARAVTPLGARPGTFDETTTVKGTEVAPIIEEAASLVLPRLGVVPDRLDAMAKAILTIRAAMMVELRFWPEQTEGDQTTYGQLRQEYRDALADYDAASQGDVANTSRVKSLRVRTFYTSDEYLASFDTP